MDAVGFDLERLQRQIRPLSLTEPVTASDAVADYFAYYRIDFERRLTGVDHYFGHFPSGRHEIVCHYFTVIAPQATCFLFHGYFDHSGLYVHLIEYCLRRNCNVVIYDLPGHGLSTGERASISSFGEYEAVLRDALALFQPHAPHPWHAIAQSTGGAILMDYLLLRSVPTFDKAVLLAPLVRAAEWRWIKTAHFIGRHFLQSVPRKFGINSSDPDFPEFLRRDPLQAVTIPVRWVEAMLRWERRLTQLPPSDRTILLVQGELDTTVDWRYNVPIVRQKFPHAKYLPLKSAHHHLANEAPAIREKIFAALDLYLGGTR